MVTRASSSTTQSHKSIHWGWRLFWAALLLLLILWLFYFLNGPPNPRYSGVPLSKWLARLNQSDPTDLEYQKAAVGIYAIGSNAIPFLLSELRAGDSRPKGKAIIWINDHSFGKIRMRSGNERQLAAVKGFQALKERGSNALPELLQMMERGSPSDYTILAVAALPEVGIIPLTNRLTHSNPHVRAYTAMALGTISNEAVVLPLINSLSDPDGGVKSDAIRSLGRLQMKEELVVPKLIDALEDSNVSVRLAAIGALLNYGKKVLAVSLTTADVQPKLSKLSAHQREEILKLLMASNRMEN